MRSTFLLFSLACALVSATGCRSHYELQLTNGRMIDAYSRPKLIDGTYFYKDGSGQPASISSSRVTLIRQR